MIRSDHKMTGKELRVRLAELRVSQVALAERAGVSVPTVRRAVAVDDEPPISRRSMGKIKAAMAELVGK